MIRSVVLWFVLVVALVGAGCTQPSSGGGGSAPVAPVASDGAPAATGGLDGY
jgi:hypothetical protein